MCSPPRLASPLLRQRLHAEQLFLQFEMGRAQKLIIANESNFASDSSFVRAYGMEMELEKEWSEWSWVLLLASINNLDKDSNAILSGKERAFYFKKIERLAIETAVWSDLVSN